MEEMTGEVTENSAGHDSAVGMILLWGVRWLDGKRGGSEHGVLNGGPVRTRVGEEAW